MLQTIIEACFTSFSHAKNDVRRQTMPAVVYPGRDIVEANDLIRRVSRGRNLYRMHQGQKPADLPVAQLTKFELTRLDSNVPAHAARLLSVLHLLRSGIGTKCECRDVRYNAALGGLAEVIWMRYGRRN